MKKSLILLPLAAVLLSLTGCKKDNEKSGPSGETVTLSATLGGGKKTEIYNETKMRWSEGDKVTINDKEYPAKFDLGYETATFENVTSDSEYEAYYPASLYQSGKYVLPATQEYDGNTLSSVNPMYAVTTTKTLQFHNICALVKLEVTGAGTVKQIVVTSTSDLCGEFSVSDEGGKCHAVISSEGGNTLTLDCGNGVELSDEPTTFYIALPQGKLGNLTFKCSGDAGVWKATPIATADLTAGKLYTKSLENVEFKKPAVFSVAAGTTVTFAPGNLYWDGSAFHFETNQWDYCVNDIHENELGELVGTWNPSHVSHFYWSKTASVAYAQDYSESGLLTSDVFFTNKTETTANPAFQVSGETAGTWRTLSKDEWNYLLGYDPGVSAQTSTYGRPNAMNLCAWVMLTDVNVYGLVILPDGSDATASGVTTSALVSSSGAVFLPAAGYRGGEDVHGVGSLGYFWSSTPLEGYEDDAYGMGFYSGLVSANYDRRGRGSAVRLVR